MVHNAHTHSHTHTSRKTNTKTLDATYFQRTMQASNEQIENIQGEWTLPNHWANLFSFIHHRFASKHVICSPQTSPQLHSVLAPLMSFHIGFANYIRLESCTFWSGDSIMHWKQGGNNIPGTKNECFALYDQIINKCCICPLSISIGEFGGKISSAWKKLFTLFS